jgi:hypothetical protein
MIPVGLILTSEIIGKEIIGETSKGIFGLLTGINEFNIPYINIFLEDLDIYKIVELVESLFNEMNNEHHTIEHIPAQILAYKNLHEINLKIKKELGILKENIELSKDYWFKYFRTPPYHDNLENLRRYKKILDSRLDIVLRLQNC